MAQLADDAQVDVYAFGIATDFRGRMFPGAKRLFELADETLLLQVEALCWCGRQGRFNARVVNGEVATEGAQVVVADVEPATISTSGTKCFVDVTIALEIWAQTRGHNLFRYPPDGRCDT